MRKCCTTIDTKISQSQSKYQRKRPRSSYNREYCSSAKNSTAIIILSSCFLLWATSSSCTNTHHHHHNHQSSVVVSAFTPSNNTPRANVVRTALVRSPLKLFSTVGDAYDENNNNDDDDDDDDDGSDKESNNYRKQHDDDDQQQQLGQKRHQWQSSSSPNDIITSSPKYHQYNRYERDQVHEWLLQSTTRILGEELTLKLVNGGGADDVDDDSGDVKNDGTELSSPDRIDSDTTTIATTSLKLPSNFSTDKEFILISESVMRAWCRWISRCSSNNDDDGGFSDMHLSFDDDDPILCTPINAVKIVDAIFNQVLVIDERRTLEGVLWEEEEGSTTTDDGAEVMGAVEWETKIVELTNVAIDIDARRNENKSVMAVSRAEGWLHFLQQRLEGRDGPCLSDHVLKLYEESYRGVIKACIRSRGRQYLERAIGLLDDMRSQQQRKNPSRADLICPATQTYNLVLYGLANTEPSPENAKRAETLLREMIAHHERGGRCAASCSPDSNSFRQVITAWTKSGSNASAAENARRILDEMISDFPMLDPDASTFNSLMTLYLKLGKTREALSLFDLINSMHESGRSDTTPDIYSVNLMLTAMTKRRGSLLSLEDMEALEEVLENLAVPPDDKSYNIVIDAWAKSNLREAASRAEQLLDTMEEKCRHGDPNVAPDGYSFTSTINAIERSRHHRARGSWAEQVFRRMKDMHSRGLVEEPTTPVYNALMNTLISSGESGSIERAEALFYEMQAANLTNAVTYNTLLKGYSTFERNKRSGRIISFSQPHKAERLLDEMELSHYTKGAASSIRPDKYSYTTVISAYGRSNAKRKAAKSFEILHRMIDSYLEGNAAAKPGTFAFNAVLNACAHTRPPGERLEGFTILCKTLILLRDWTTPDHTTYGTFLQASSNLLPRDEARKLRVVEAVFLSCVEEGQCGQMVVRNLKNVASPELYDALVGRFVTEDGLDIPLRWRRNVAGHNDCLATSYFDS